jgi:hypothetical protein
MRKVKRIGIEVFKLPSLDDLQRITFRCVSLTLEFKAFIVWLILNGKVEEALAELAKHYGVNVPKVKVGLPKRHKKNVFGCYTGKNETIFVSGSDALKEPFVILHEFYHHLRTSVDKKHKGTENYASRFAAEFIEAYKSM